MELNGIISISIWFSAFFLILIFNKPIKKILHFNSFWIILSLGWLAYFLAGRYIPLIINSANNESDRLFQNILLTDFCPFFALVIPFISLFGKKARSVASYASGWGLFSAHVTSYQIFFAAPTQNQLPWFNYIFYSNDFNNPNTNNGLFFMTHFMIMVYSLFLIIDRKKVGFRYYFWNMIVMASYLIYVSIFKYSLNLQHNTTGIGIEDWDTGGQYNIVSQVLNIPVSVVWPIGYILSVAGNLVICLVFIIAKNEFWKPRKINQENIKALFKK